MTTPSTHSTHKKEYWNIMIHSVIAYIGHSAMQMVDLLFCRNLGSEASATVGTGSALFAWFMIIGLGMVTSLEFFIPHATGEKNFRRAHSFFISGQITAVGMGILSALGLVGLSFLSNNLGINPLIADTVKSYGLIIALSYIPTFLIPVLRVELQTRGHPHDTTIAFLLANVLNVFLNWVLVLGNLGFPAMGVLGGAWASVLSRHFILFYLLLRAYYFRRGHIAPIPFKEIEIKKCIKEMIQLGTPSSLHYLFEMGAFVFVSTLASRLSAAQSAAHAIAITLASFSFMVPLGIGSAASQTISKAYGENDLKEAKLLGKISIQLGLFYGLIASLSFVFFRYVLVKFYTTDAETIQCGATLLMIVAVFQFGDVMQVILAGCIRGLGETKIQAKVNAVGHWCLGIPLGIFLGFYLKLEIIGLWIGLCSGLWFVALSLLVSWKKRSLALQLPASSVNVVST